MNHLVLQGDNMIIHQQQAHSSVAHQLLQKGVGSLVIIKAHFDSQVQEEVPIP